MAVSADYTLVQKSSFGARQRLSIREGALDFSLRTLLSRTSYTMDLHTLNPKATRHREIPRQWLFGSCLFGTPAIALLSLLPFVQDADARIALGVLGSLLVVPTLMCVSQMIKFYSNLLIFHNRYDGRAAVSLWHGKPSPEEFNHFVEVLQERIEAAIKEWEAETHHTLAHEIRELAKLREEGLLSEEEFRQAKARVLGLDTWQVE